MNLFDLTLIKFAESDMVERIGNLLAARRMRSKHASAALDSVNYLEESGVFGHDKVAGKDFESVSKPEGLRKKMDGVSLGKDKKGYFVYTHRARSSAYPTPEDIPDSKIKFIESTG